MKPIHKRAIDWAHERGMVTHMNSYGKINPFISELIGIGLDALNPLELKSGIAPVEVKKIWKSIVFRGGNNAALWDSFEKTEADHSIQTKIQIRYHKLDVLIQHRSMIVL